MLVWDGNTMEDYLTSGDSALLSACDSNDADLPLLPPFPKTHSWLVTARVV
jgi:hypothetical protein